MDRLLGLFDLDGWGQVPEASALLPLGEQLFAWGPQSSPTHFRGIQSCPSSSRLDTGVTWSPLEAPNMPVCAPLVRKKWGSQVRGLC